MSCNNKEWKTVKLKDISTDGKGFYGIGAPAVDFNENLYTYLRITDITDDGRINKDGLKSVADENAKDYLLKKNDIVFARTGNSTGRAYFYNEKDGNLVYAGFLIKFNLDETKVNPKYIKYFTLSPEYKKWVNSFATGSTRKNINAKMFGDMQIELPNREYQNKVVNILEPLSQKIEHNIEMNRTLEEMAQTLFKHWFIDFEFPNEKGEPYKSSGGKFVESELGMIPEGWKIKKMGELTEKFTTGLNPRKNFVLGKGDNYYVTIKNMINGNVVLDDRCDKIDDDAIAIINKRSDLKEGDILFSAIGTIGRVFLIDEKPQNWNISESIFTLRANNEITTEILYYLLLSHEFQSYARQLSSGSVQKGIRMSDFKEFKVALPSIEIQKKLSKVLGSLIKKYKENFRGNQTLTELRDILLPKLMSGEIRIPEAEEAVESCLQKNN